MKISEIRAFLAVADAGSVHGAAARLNLTQPAVSRLIQRLEADLQAKLFLTCWLVFVLHFATDIVREHYLAFSLAEDYSFRMDKYYGLNVDIVDTPGHADFGGEVERIGELQSRSGA